MIFEPAVPPGDRVGFLAWFAGVLRLSEGHLSSDPYAASARLQGWYRDIMRTYPPTSGPDAGRFETSHDERLAEYRFGPNVIVASFQWDVSRAAHDRAMKIARAHGLGLFDTSGEDAAVWAPTPDQRFVIVHRGEKAAERF